MKTFFYKTRHIWVAVLAILIGLALTGCATISEKTGKCVEISEALHKRLQREGKVSRIGHGWYRGQPHCWVEYKKDGVWYIQDDSIASVGRGFTFDEHGDYKRGSYEY